VPALIEANISKATGQDFKLTTRQGLSGGSINQAQRIDGKSNNEAISFFIKFNHKNRLEMFSAEAAGLAQLEQAQSIRVPKVICSGIEGSQSYLVLEHLNLTAASTGSIKQLGQNLAKLHQNTVRQFGWQQDNTIGATKQVNTQSDNWITFWCEHRLGFQLDLAKQNGAGRSLLNKGEKLLDAVEAFFIDYQPEPSLLHGDLWSGNYGFVENGEPVIFDPAVYYGDRETDIAMTELFGGFPREFYAAYNDAWPLDKGYVRRKTLYNLYHILNHFNLFGGGYAMQAENMLDHLSR
jgi:fructosamine-3-kinase